MGNFIKGLTKIEVNSVHLPLRANKGRDFV
jgi:hypothetical protein